MSADDTQWPVAPKNYANTRFSGLDQINTQNVNQLKMAWSFSLGADRGQEAAPLVVDGKIFLSTLDGYSVAIDAASGKELWYTKLADINKGETITMAPLVVKGKILIGNSGGEMGVRGWVTAVDENTGQIVWRAYHTGTDKDVPIGPDFKPFYQRNKGEDLGVKSWPPDHWKIGGETMWGWIQ